MSDTLQHREDLIENLRYEIEALQSERDKLKDVLDEARVQIEYMHEKFKKTGSGNAVLAQIDRVLKSYNEKGGNDNG